MPSANRCASFAAAARAFLDVADAQTCQNFFSAGLFRGFFGKFVLRTFSRAGSAAADSEAESIRPCSTHYQFQNTAQRSTQACPFCGVPGAKGPGQRFGYFAAEGKVTRPGGRNSPACAEAQNSLFSARRPKFLSAPGREIPLYAGAQKNPLLLSFVR